MRALNHVDLVVEIYCPGGRGRLNIDISPAQRQLFANENDGVHRRPAKQFTIMSACKRRSGWGELLVANDHACVALVMRCTGHNLLNGGNAYRLPVTFALNGDPSIVPFGDEVDPVVSGCPCTRHIPPVSSEYVRDVFFEVCARHFVDCRYRNPRGGVLLVRPPPARQLCPRGDVPDALLVCCSRGGVVRVHRLKITSLRTERRGAVRAVAHGARAARAAPDG